MSLCAKRLWTIGSGSGGVGKSFLTAFMGTALASENRSVILVDGDLASPHLYAYLGIKPPAVTLLDVVEKRARLSDALLQTSRPQMRFLGCVADELGMADLAPGLQQRMAECLSSLEADHILIDAGTGTSFRVLDFFNLTAEGIIVTVPDPASMQRAYGFLRHSIYRRIQKRFGADPDVAGALDMLQQRTHPSKPKMMTDFLDLLVSARSGVIEGVAEMVDEYRPVMLMNLGTTDQDRHFAEILQSAAVKFLNVEVRFGGLIHDDPAVSRAAHRSALPDLGDAESLAARQCRQIALSLAGCRTGVNNGSAAGAAPVPSAPAIMGLNDNLVLMGRDLHIQTEGLGDGSRSITTNVFCDGRVILTTKSEYPETLQSRHLDSRVADLMRSQHFNVIREIESRSAKDPSTL
ncbi:MAG: hypothetical protein H6Q05_816 [Acidobacteria bacterium]|nr:hypothetical protein [Acidobacteriota bacterium]